MTARIGSNSAGHSSGSFSAALSFEAQSFEGRLKPAQRLGRAARGESSRVSFRIWILEN
jgi:hypothetical protein